MKKLTFLLIALIVIVILTTAGCDKKESSQPEPAATQPEAAPSQELAENSSRQEVIEVNFTKTGNMVNWDANTETYINTWTLVYEEAPSPAIPVELIFSDTSMCSINGEQEECLKAIKDKKITNGAMVKVEGKVTGRAKVTVVSLQLISPGE